jgi:hypothetical protein
MCVYLIVSGSSRRGPGLSWTTWGAIMMAAYKLPPLFPDQLGISIYLPIYLYMYLSLSIYHRR